MSKKTRKLYILILICGLYLPMMVWPFVKGKVGLSTTENRELATRPSLSVENYGTFATEFEDYFNDHLPFRRLLVKYSNLIDLSVFRISPNEDVIAGKNGWYYIAETLEDYEQNNLYTEEELNQIAKDVITTQAYFDEKGIEFVIFIVPNKNTIYGENMPGLYRKCNDSSRTDQLVEYLQEHTETAIVYPKKEMQALKEEDETRLLYLQLDTHWNYLGAYVGAQQVLSAVGIEWPTVDEISYEKVDWTDGHDLTNMMGLSDVINQDENYTIEGYPKADFSFENEWGFDVPAIYTYQRSISNSENHKKLFFLRDSFGTAIMRYMASAFEEVYSPHIQYFTVDQIEEEDPDVFILELAERRDIRAFLPIS